MPTLNELFPLGNPGSTVDCLYGDTGSTKTSRLGDAAEYYYKRTGKPSRLVSSDTGGWAPIPGCAPNPISRRSMRATMKQ